MTKFYPTRNDLTEPDKVERVVKDVYDKLNKTTKPAPPATPKRIDIHTGKVITGG